ncbi:putative glutathione S-transferase parC [Castanea sativa]|uniref:putative glutathione S-transferase parC n=1 Tax=Castanea sativa TaxID=21020 RepID=UPI003F64DD16
MQVFDVEKRTWTTKIEENDVPKKEFIETFKILEGELGDKPFFGGETFGFVDLALIPFYSRFDVSGMLIRKFNIVAVPQNYCMGPGHCVCAINLALLHVLLLYISLSPSLLQSFEFRDNGTYAVVLLDFWLSVFGMRVRIALAEKGMNYEYKEQDLWQKTPLLLQMNLDHKMIPVLIHNRKPVCESLVIVQYIDEVWKDKSPLLPTDPFQRAIARFWADFVNKKVCSDEKRIWLTKGEEREEAKKELIESFKILEGEFSETCLTLGGKTIGFVNIALITFYRRFYSSELFGKFSIEAECPKIIAWAKRCMQKDTVAKSLPDHKKVYEFLVQLRNKLGLD